MTATPSERSKVLSLGRTYCDIIFTGLREMPALGREPSPTTRPSRPEAAPKSRQRISPPWDVRPPSSPALAPIHAGFLHSWLETSDLGTSLASGIEAGSLCVKLAGGAPPRSS